VTQKTDKYFKESSSDNFFHEFRRNIDYYFLYYVVATDIYLNYVRVYSGNLTHIHKLYHRLSWEDVNEW